MQRLFSSLTVIGALMCGASAVYAYGTGPSAAVLATEPAFTRVHGTHTDCVFGKAFPTWLQDSWHKHPGGNLLLNASCQPPAPPPSTKKGTLNPQQNVTIPPPAPQKPAQTR
jgi:hypothetical protein